MRRPEEECFSSLFPSLPPPEVQAMLERGLLHQKISGHRASLKIGSVKSPLA
jgi:hypothetical protein